MSGNRRRRHRRIKRRKRKGWILTVLMLVVVLIPAGLWILIRDHENTGKNGHKSKTAGALKEDTGADGQRGSADGSPSEFYFQQLSEEEQSIYESLLECVSAHRESGKP